MRIFMAFLVLIGISSSASAQSLFDQGKVIAQIKDKNISDTVFKSMQCEIGLFAVKARAYGIDPGLKAHVKWSTSGTRELNPTLSGGFGGFIAQFIQLPNIKVGYDFIQVDSNTIEGKLNLNQGNTAVCIGGRRAAIPLGIYDCLLSGESVIKGGLTQSCTRKVTAKASFDASGKFAFWIITLGPEILFSNMVGYEMDIDAPATDTPARGTQTAKN